MFQIEILNMMINILISLYQKLFFLPILCKHLSDYFSLCSDAGLVCPRKGRVWFGPSLEH